MSRGGSVVRPAGPAPEGWPDAGASSALSGAAERGELARLVDPASPLVPILDAAGCRFLRPLHAHVIGRPGTGRDTMVRALRERLRLTATGPADGAGADADADLWVLVLAGPPRHADHDLLRSAPADRTLVVLGKADTHPDWDTAVAVARRWSTRLGTPVHVVSQLLACADLDDRMFTALTELAAAGAEMPSMAGRFLVGRPGSAERAVREALLRRIDAFGVDTALSLLAEGSDAADAASLNRTLHALSGVHDLAGPIGERVALVRRRREDEIRAELERAAARGLDRDGAERLLATGGVA
ncbi:hypothetical protein [Gordonia paraffinivorans]|uniref:Uncharacterized protein n=1 Tax=Gordonia paraffinivorans TaxID=175628 RepID=A0ABD7V4S8_9ACTN|nr:Uncharacterised protein [Gordonia paraffinivorans]